LYLQRKKEKRKRKEKKKEKNKDLPLLRSSLAMEGQAQ